MSGRRSQLVTAIVCCACTIAMLVILWNRPEEYHVRSLFGVELKQLGVVPFDPGFWPRIVSNVSRIATENLPAASTGVDTVVAERVGSPRGTAMIFIEYRGGASNTVHCAASRVAQSVISFYATNNSGALIVLVESEPFTHPSLRERFKSAILSCWQWCAVR